MKAYTVNNYVHDLRTDIWMLKEIGRLPDNPPVKIEHFEDYDRITIVDNFSMPAMQDAVKQYRTQLAPIIFTLAQKVYAELFRLVLGQSNLPSRKRQLRTQAEIGYSIKQNLESQLIVSPVFKDREEFDDWWQGRYHFNDLREARSSITHEYYSFKDGQLVVKDEKGITVLNWTTDEVFTFAQCVLAKASQFVSFA